jgi:uncharacterized protein YuzE
MTQWGTHHLELAYAKRGQVTKAEALLEEMIIDYSTNGNVCTEPTVDIVTLLS